MAAGLLIAAFVVVPPRAAPAVPVSANGHLEIDTGAPGKSIIGTLTITGAQGDGYAAAYPCANGWSGTSNVNFRQGVDIANLIVVPADPTGKICVLASQQTHLVFDQTAEVDLGTSTPVRLVDTRNTAKVGAAESFVIHTGTPDKTVVGNLTATGPDSAGFLSLYPCASGWTGTSNLNFAAAQTVANAFFARADPAGDLCVRTSARTHVVVDRFAAIAMDAPNSRRVFDSRPARIPPNAPIAFQTGKPNTAFVGNLTVTGATAAGYGAVFTCPPGWPNAVGSPPTTSNTNYGTTDAAALFVATTDPRGLLCVLTSSTANVIVDEIAQPAFAIHQPTRVLDTRVARPGDVPQLGGCAVFPPDNPWNQRIDTLAVRAESATWVANLGTTRMLHPDFGGPYGIPFSIVPANQPQLPITFTAYGDESDPGPYPIPLTAPIEGGSSSTGDRHVLVLQTGSCKVFELGRAFPQSTRWNAEVGATFDLASNTLRPEHWTSADAAGLPMLPGLVRYEDIADGVLRHAVRFTAQCTQRGYIHPAVHQAGVSNAACPPMGARFRLKPSFDTSRFTGQSRIILDGLKTHGLIVADNGSNWYITGSQDARWNVDDLEQLKTVPGGSFEAVESGPILN